MSQINEIVIITGGDESEAIASLSPHLTVTHDSGKSFEQYLAQVSDGSGFGGGKVSGTHVYGACLNGGPLPDEWGEMLDSAPWKLRWSVLAYLDFELFGMSVWSGRHGWLLNCDERVPVTRTVTVRHQRVASTKREGGR